MNQLLEIKNDTKEIDEVKTKLVIEAIKEAGYNLFDNLTTKEVAKDLKLGMNKANDVFRREDFPSVNIGKTKTISVLAYFLWKLDKREE